MKICCLLDKYRQKYEKIQFIILKTYTETGPPLYTGTMVVISGTAPKQNVTESSFFEVST